MQRIAITGHRGLDRDTSRLVRQVIRSALSVQQGPIVGLTCLADGSDQIFGQAVIEHGGSLEVFIAGTRFSDSLLGESRVTYEMLRGLSAIVHTLPFADPCPESFMQASRLMIDSADLLWAVWDGAPARGYGGTADVVAYARRRDVPVRIIWPAGAWRAVVNE